MVKKILITGSEGFVGSRLIEKFENKYDLTLFDKKFNRDITNPESFKGLDVDYVIHLAAITRSDNLFEMFDVNVNGTFNVLEFCKNSGANLIFASSSAVYGNIESPITETSNLNPSSYYAITKKLGEELCKFYYDNFSVNNTILRIFNPYGPNQTEGFLIPDILSQLGESEINLGNPYQKRDYIYIDDLVDAIDKSLDLNKFNIINIGTGTSYCVKELVKKITDKKVNFSDLSMVESDIYADISKAKKLLSWVPKVSLEEGIKYIS
ncbi:NAD(P)-dependent oxidoreductase [archaeon]|nr:NAD(P)-dependent oxidoreductase [archaeon]MBT6824227.1 NAD(P)-dependent oxidoreductase [archaeon]MBT7106765.1 NAD(P)-dependent oxidoreductase [archaeon]MBT7297541.1 NAD(P)-dependent oxidoreductase [archaeon]